MRKCLFGGWVGALLWEEGGHGKMYYCLFANEDFQLQFRVELTVYDYCSCTCFAIDDLGLKYKTNEHAPIEFLLIWL